MNNIYNRMYKSCPTKCMSNAVGLGYSKHAVKIFPSHIQAPIVKHLGCCDKALSIWIQKF